MNVQEFIERGNEYFSNSKYQKALNYYTQAINTISDADNLEELFQTNESFHKCFANRAKCYLELKEYVNSLDDASIVLSIYPDDKNILFVLSQIYKELKQYEKALDYANRLDSNSDLNAYLNELNGLIKEKLMQLEIKKKDIKKLLTSKILDAESIKLVLGMLKDEEFSDGCKDEVVECLNTLIETVKKTNQTKSIKKGIMQIFAEICQKSSQKTQVFYNKVQGDLLAKLISDQDKEISDQAYEIIKTMIMSLTDLENMRNRIQKQRKNRFDFTSTVDQYIDEIFRSILKLIIDPNCSGYGRDNCIHLCTKYVNKTDGCGWTNKFIEYGLDKLLKIAATVPDLKLTKSLPLTENTHIYTATCLKTIFSDIYTNQEMKKFQETLDDFINDLLKQDEKNSKIQALSCLSVILQGPYDSGLNFIDKNKNIIQYILTLADSEDCIQEQIALEIIFYSATRKEGFFPEGGRIFKRLKNSKNQSIKARALAGICRYSSYKIVTDEDESILATSCKSLLCSNSNIDCKIWACEGLAALTSTSPKIRDLITDDTETIKTFKSLTKKDDKRLFLSIANVLFNICNPLPPEDPIQTEQIGRASKALKQTLPDIDTEERIITRRQNLIEQGILEILKSIIETGKRNHNIEQLISAIYMAYCQDDEVVAKIVDNDHVKLIIQLALDGTLIGKIRAGLALARIVVRIQHDIAFSDDMGLNIVGPIVKLLDTQRDQIENFEGLIALNELASANEKYRKQIVKEQGISNIEQYMFNDDEFLRRLGTECINNLVQDEDVVFFYEKPDNDRVKLLVLYCAEEDIELNVSACNALVQLTEISEKICQKIVDISSFASTFQQCINSEEPELQIRGLNVLKNIASKNKILSSFIADSELHNSIIELTNSEEDQVKNLAIEIENIILNKE